MGKKCPLGGGSVTRQSSSHSPSLGSSPGGHKSGLCTETGGGSGIRDPCEVKPPRPSHSGHQGEASRSIRESFHKLCWMPGPPQRTESHCRLWLGYQRAGAIRKTSRESQRPKPTSRQMGRRACLEVSPRWVPCVRGWAGNQDTPPCPPHPRAGASPRWADQCPPRHAHLESLWSGAFLGKGPMAWLQHLH